MVFLFLPSTGAEVFHSISGSSVYLDVLMAYYKAKLKCNGDKTSSCFRPFWTGVLHLCDWWYLYQPPHSQLPYNFYKFYWLTVAPPKSPSKLCNNHLCMCSGLILISPSNPITKYFCVLQSHCNTYNVLSCAADPCLSCWASNNSQFTFSACTGDFWKMFTISVTLHNFIILCNITQNFTNISIFASWPHHYRP